MIPGRPALAGRPGDPDRGAVDPFRGEAQIIRDRYWRLAGGRAPVPSPDLPRICPALRGLWT